MALRGQEGEDWCWEVSGGRIDGGSQSHLGRLGEEPGRTLTGRSRMLGQFTFRLLIFSSYDTYGHQSGGYLSIGFFLCKF